jgi:hypothetical protein
MIEAAAQTSQKQQQQGEALYRLPFRITKSEAIEKHRVYHKLPKSWWNATSEQLTTRSVRPIYLPFYSVRVNTVTQIMAFIRKTSAPSDGSEDELVRHALKSEFDDQSVHARNMQIYASFKLDRAMVNQLKAGLLSRDQWLTGNERADESVVVDKDQAEFLAFDVPPATIVRKTIDPYVQGSLIMSLCV